MNEMKWMNKKVPTMCFRHFWTISHSVIQYLYNHFYIACNKRLGMESKEIAADQIKLSDHGVFNDTKMDQLGRLYSPVCWMSDATVKGVLLEVNLIDLHTITGIITQGGFAWDTHLEEEIFMWPESYRIFYTTDPVEYERNIFGDSFWPQYRQLDRQEMVCLKFIRLLGHLWHATQNRFLKLITNMKNSAKTYVCFARQ